MFPRLNRIKKSVYARIKFVIFMKLKGIKSIKKGYRIDERYIKRRYSKYWKEKGFNPNASIEEKLKFLYRKGEYEVVGAYYRNGMMKKWEENESIRYCIFPHNSMLAFLKFCCFNKIAKWGY
ncbi:MAG: hypothetical protein QXE46_03080 [Candidatus Thermoplasmatota archaeon]